MSGARSAWIAEATGEAIARGAARIKAGQVVAFATETVYGLGADATNAMAVARIFEIKQRPAFNPLIVHVAEVEAARGVVTRWPAIADVLAQRFWPGGLTLVLARDTQVIPDIVTAGLPGVAVRIPDHRVALELISAAGCPIAAPSANRFGRVSPTTALHVAQSLGDEVGMILDGGPCRAGVESTVLSLTTEVPTLLRPGAVSIEAIESAIGAVARRPKAVESAPESPGLLDKHYATRTALYISGSEPAGLDRGRVGRLVLSEIPGVGGHTCVEILSESGDLTEAGTNLFAAMRRLDEAGLDAIVADLAPEHGLGVAINDRLRRAARR